MTELRTFFVYLFFKGLSNMMNNFEKETFLNSDIAKSNKNYSIKKL